MSNRLLKTVTLLVFTAFSTLALADDPPARVGRVALAQGPVSISGTVGAPPASAQVNWPVTSQNTITTAPGARTEIRIGSTSVRLDGGSALEVTDLDDDNLHLRLHYGSVSVRIVNADVVVGFELETPQARVRLQQPGRIRVDAERVPDTSVVQVFEGEVQVEGGGTNLALGAGRRAEVTDEGVRTAQATRDAFDDWSIGRDQYDDRSQSTRYVASEMTGYEDLDRYGSWSNDAEYGALWLPSVGPDWVPYSDGSWAWIDPWGWTWIDNAPWGYAPFHYGRWVHVRNRWAWAPGRHDRRPVWAPALVGWVGGAGWNLTFRDQDMRRPLPAQGWFPLGPHDRFEPSFRASEAHLRWWNRNVGPEQRHDRDRRREGLTVVPHDAFGRRDRVDVGRVPHATPAPGALAQLPGGAPPPPLSHERARGREDGRDRFDRGRADRGQRPLVLTAPSVPPGQQPLPQPRPPLTAATPDPVQPGRQFENEPGRRDRRQGREGFEDGRGQRPLRTAPPPLGTAIASPPTGGPAAGTAIASPPMQRGPAPGTAIASPPLQSGPPAGTAIGSQPLQGAPGFARPERGQRGDGGFERRGDFQRGGDFERRGGFQRGGEHRVDDPRPGSPQAFAAPPVQSSAPHPAMRAPMPVAQAAPLPQASAPPPPARPMPQASAPPPPARPMPTAPPTPAGPPPAPSARPMPAAPPAPAPGQAAAAQRGEERQGGGRDRGVRQQER